MSAFLNEAFRPQDYLCCGFCVCSAFSISSIRFPETGRWTPILSVRFATLSNEEKDLFSSVNKELLRTHVSWCQGA